MKYILFVLVFILSPIAFSNAQVDFNIADQGLTIDLEPLNPEPFAEFTASLNDYSLAAQVSGIRWKVDSVSIPEANNQRTISLKAKGANKSTVIDATIDIVGGGTQSVRKVVSPVYLDIIVEAQTRTPAFYQGRGLPSIGSQINLTALINSDSISKNELIYTWRLNNNVVEGGSSRGKNKITMTIPQGKFVIVTLDVSKLDGEVLVRRSIQLPSVAPKVHFYEVSSLYGLSHKPITNLSLIGESATVQAEPYNLDILTYNSPELLEWKLGGDKSPNTSNNPYEITLAKQGGSGATSVDFHVRNLTQLLQGSQGKFQINF